MTRAGGRAEALITCVCSAGGQQHMKRCIDSGLWVPNARADEEAEKEPQDEGRRKSRRMRR